MKSTTGSRKMIELLNRYGHTPSYNTIEEIETELTFTHQRTKIRLQMELIRVLDLELVWHGATMIDSWRHSLAKTHYMIQLAFVIKLNCLNVNHRRLQQMIM